jgi:hypothetical protein
MRDPILRAELAERGVFFPPMAIMAEDGYDASGTYNAGNDRLRAWKRDWLIAADANPSLVSPELRYAMDAQPGMITTPNAGVPLLFTSIVDPQVVRTVFQVLSAEDVYGAAVQKGSWVTQVDYFPLVEPTGQVATYGDYSENGAVDVNAQWTPRQPYGYQTFKRYGEQQMARWGAAGLNYSAELDVARAIKFNQFQNNSYFFGVTGLVNYGSLNDPSLIAAIAPYTKAAGGTAWTNATADEEYNDIALKLYTQLVTQMGGNVRADTPMTLALSTLREPLLARKTQYGMTVREYLMSTFPNLRIVTAPQFSTQAGELVQLIIGNYEGVQTVVPAYTEKLRAHAVVTESSSWRQKLSGGTWGAIIRRPIAIAQMIGI